RALAWLPGSHEHARRAVGPRAAAERLATRDAPLGPWPRGQGGAARHRVRAAGGGRGALRTAERGCPGWCRLPGPAAGYRDPGFSAGDDREQRMAKARDIALLVLGWVLVVAGIAALVLPGPGLVMVFAG